MKFILGLLKFLLFIALFAALSLFAYENSQLIQVQFLHWLTPEIPLSMAILAALLLGFIAGCSFFIFKNIKLKAKLRSARKQSKKLQREIDDLRNNPLYESSAGTLNTNSKEPESDATQTQEDNTSPDALKNAS